jgi:chemotaxis methyl-accepting protein methylase
MTVSISRFFRDQRLWEVLQEEILPGLIERHREKIRVWSAGCASGEEVYSIRILWDNLGESMAHMPELEITATDMNPMYLERARAGIYASSSLKEVPEKFKSVYFQKTADSKRYSVDSELKRGIIWKTHHLLSDPPGSQFDLIFLRNNLLTYYQDESKKSGLEKVTNCLASEGFLIIGSHERLPHEAPALLPFGSLSYVFTKTL